MKTGDAIKKLTLGMVVGGLFAWQANATIAYNMDVGLSGNQNGGPYSVGNIFTVSSSPISVTALGAFDPGQAAFGSGGVDVAIYSVVLTGTAITGGSLITSLNFSGTQSSFSGSTALQSITPVTLTAGTYMVVANNYGVGGSALDYNPAYDTENGSDGTTPAVGSENKVTFNNADGVTFSTAGYFATSGAFVSDPTTLGMSPDTGPFGSTGPRYGAGNFDFAPVPEAAVFGTASAALLGLIYVGRCGLRKRKLA